mgnify:CR=1 FL=1
MNNIGTLGADGSNTFNNLIFANTSHMANGTYFVKCSVLGVSSPASDCGKLKVLLPPPPLSLSLPSTSLFALN